MTLAWFTGRIRRWKEERRVLPRSSVKREREANEEVRALRRQTVGGKQAGRERILSWDRLVGWVGGWLGERVGGWGVARGGPSRVSQRGSERRCSAIVSGGAARSRLELSHAPTSTSIHLPASASDRFLVWTIRPGCLPPPLPALNPINNAVGSRLRVTAILPARFPRREPGLAVFAGSSR